MAFSEIMTHVDKMTAESAAIAQLAAALDEADVRPGTDVTHLARELSQMTDKDWTGVTIKIAGDDHTHTEGYSAKLTLEHRLNSNDNSPVVDKKKNRIVCFTECVDLGPGKIYCYVVCTSTQDGFAVCTWYMP